MFVYNMKVLLIGTLHPKNLAALNKYDLSITNSNDVTGINLNDFDVVYSPSRPINSSAYPTTKFIFGPHFSVFPNNSAMNIIRSTNSIYIQPSEWASDVWAKNPMCHNIRIKSLPFGVDTEKFNEIKLITERNKVFVYFKRRHPVELELVTKFLKSQNISFKVFDYVTKYNQDDYIDYLHESKFGIWLGAHESQGFALEEALSCNVPLLVWNVVSMKQEHGSNYSDIQATSIPYWDERCGESFIDFHELKLKYHKFIKCINEYKPREFVLENLSIEVCSKKFIEIVNNIDPVVSK